MKFLIILSFLFCFKAFSIVGHDDRFYVHGTKWADLLNGIVELNDCTGFVLEGDVIVTAAHCFESNYYWDEIGRKVFFDVITKDLKINYKNIKKLRVNFGDANLDKNDKTKKSHFNKYSEIYRVKDLFLGKNNLFLKENFNFHGSYSKDYAFIKLEKPIPKNIKRFKIFDSDLLKDYKILKHSYRGNLSLAGYHGDNSKTYYQRMAHIGCKTRDLIKYKKIWFEFTDCDTYDGASGSPLFYILRHKKSKRIELAVSSLLLAGDASRYQGRKLDDQLSNEKDNKIPKYQLGWGHHYYAPIITTNTSASMSLLLTNHKEFLKNLKKFKRNPSFFKGQKLPQPSYNKYYDKKWVLKKIQKTDLKKLKNFLQTSLKKKDQLSRDYFVIYLRLVYEKNRNKISRERMKILTSFYEDYLIEKTKQRNQLYPYKKRTKKMNYEKLTELEKKFERKDPDTYEDSIDDKEKAQKLWKMYFGK